MALIVASSFLAFFILFSGPDTTETTTKQEVGGKAPFYEGHDNVIEKNPHTQKKGVNI